MTGDRETHREEEKVSFPLKPVLIALGPEEVQRLLAIAFDGQAEEALAFVREELLKRVEKALARH